jgi:hypothetical protein
MKLFVKLLTDSLVNSREDLDDVRKTFHPEFTHQIFPEEKILGYKGLQINLFYRYSLLIFDIVFICSASSLTSYLDIKFEQKNNHIADDVKGILLEYLPKDIHQQPLTNIDEFIKVT